MEDITYPIRLPLRYPIYDSMVFHAPITNHFQEANIITDLGSNRYDSNPGVNDSGTLSEIEITNNDYGVFWPGHYKPTNTRQGNYYDFENVYFDASFMTLELSFIYTFDPGVASPQPLFGYDYTISNRFGTLEYFPGVEQEYIRWSQGSGAGVPPSPHSLWSTGTGTVSDGEYHHIVITHIDNYGDQCWVDGIQMVDYNTPYNMTCKGLTLCAGMYIDSIGNHTGGWKSQPPSYIEEINIYERVLTEPEILNRYRDIKLRTQNRNHSIMMMFSGPAIFRNFVSRFNPMPSELRVI